MAQKSFYVDACIYLNLWQKEGDETKGIPYWKLAEDFFEKLEEIDAVIYYSGFLLKEIKFILAEDEFNNKTRLFKASPNFMKLELSDDELKQARQMESELDYEISFYDIIHMILAKKSDSILITRDKKLITAAEQYGVVAKKPEDIL